MTLQHVTLDHLDPPVVRAPTAEQLTAWRTLLIAHAQLTRRLEAELIAEHELPLASYDVLVQLAEADGEDARGTLAVLTPAGLDRLRTASVTHLRGVHDHVTSRLEDTELAELARLLTKLTPART